MLRVSIFL